MMLKKLSCMKNMFFVLITFCLLGISFSGYSAEAKKTPQKITLSGIINVNKDPSESGYIPPGRYILVSDAYTGPSGNMLFTYVGTQYVNGVLGFDLGNGFYGVIGIRDSSGDHWDGQYTNDARSETGARLLLSIITDSTGTAFTGSFSTNNLELGMVNDPTGEYKGGHTALVYLDVTINVSNSSCLITTPHDAVFNWPSISPSEIRNGSVTALTAPVTMSCTNSGEEGVIARPVAITFTSSNGSQDAANGIIKTDKENLGLQLTWHSNGQPIPQDKVIEFPAIASATEDFSVDAKPVAISGSDQISGGSFATTVTMSVEYR